MNKSNLKSYAPQARRDFIAAVTARANQLGLDQQHGQLKVAPSQTQGDVTVIAGQAWPAKVDAQRQQLVARMQQGGFAQTIEAVAYTWFNRFAALRYMELHDYLGHGHRALSSREGGLPEVLARASELAQAGGLPGLRASVVNELKLAGNRDGELYRLLLIAQCNALHLAMPFLFEQIDDDTELLLPDNLLLSDSVVAKLVQAIPEDDWAEVEIIGWLYQFYISEKKDQVIGKVVKSEDIPAATQLFTPNWIVQYLVQNSVGRLWLMANPASTLASQWPYYIQPAEQTPEVQAQLDALIQTRMDEEGGSLNPETITVLDPACGSGHILVVAYDVLKAIYLERGYQARAIPRLILEKNLYGLDIDDRAAQMAGFALLMKARADDRRLFNEPPKLNVLSLQESKGLDAAALAAALLPLPLGEGRGEGSPLHTIGWLIETFEHAKTFGSLIQIGLQPTSNLRKLLSIMQQSMQTGDLYAQAAAQDVLPLVQQALVLGMQFDAVVANPPYMGAKFYGGILKQFVEDKYREAKGDLYTCFMVRAVSLANDGGLVGMITIPNWMFLSTFEGHRNWFLAQATIETFTHNGRGVFGSDFGSSAFTFRKRPGQRYIGRYQRLFDKQGSVASNEELEERFLTRTPYNAAIEDFERIPGKPIAYWASQTTVQSFADGAPVGQVAETRKGMGTGDNARFVRYWHEVAQGKVSFVCSSREEARLSGKRWFPYNDGGAFRKWYGNNDMVVNWEDDGREAKENAVVKNNGAHWSRYLVSLDYFFKPGITWTAISSAKFSARMFDKGFLFSSAGMCLFSPHEDRTVHLGFLNSIVSSHLLTFLSPTLNYGAGEVGRLPLILSVDNGPCSAAVQNAIEICREDWNEGECSWDFDGLHLFHKGTKGKTLKSSSENHLHRSEERRASLRSLETTINSIFIKSYRLGDELSPEVSDKQISLSTACGEDDSRRLISYAIGCMMGRYSLDEPGLIYAHAGNVGFDASRYSAFPADADGIVPLTDELWFTDDAASRVREFLLAVWGADTLEQNMAWLAESLGTKGSETPDETIRRYLADKFFKDHLQTYKKRPIYWLFSSGKHAAFQALVYLHRYTEGTLARLRAEYVVPLTGKMQARLDMLQKDALAASTTTGRNKINKEIEKLKKKHLELLAYDEKLRHHADMRITLDLDDGVKVNYGKFGDLLEGVKLVTGGAGDE
jgi:hypothetical protein